MKKHLISFLKSPIGYVANFIATLDGYKVCGIRIRLLPESWQCDLCETFCLKDGVQDDCMF